MITNTNSAGVFDDGDHNTTQMSIVDLFEPAGTASPSVFRIALTCQQELRGKPTWKATNL